MPICGLSSVPVLDRRRGLGEQADEIDRLYAVEVVDAPPGRGVGEGVVLNDARHLAERAAEWRTEYDKSAQLGRVVGRRPGHVQPAAPRCLRSWSAASRGRGKGPCVRERAARRDV